MILLRENDMTFSADMISVYSLLMGEVGGSLMGQFLSSLFDNACIYL